MTKKELFLSLAAGFLSGLFLIPTLINTGYYYKIPFINPILFVVLPALAAFGMFVANFIGKRILLIWQFAKFSLVGVLNTAIDFGILNLLIFATGITQGLGIFFIAGISFSCATINSYFWNRDFTFGSSRKAAQSFPIFAVVTLIGLLINSSLVYLLSTYVFSQFVTSATLAPNLAKVVATFVSLVWNFAGYRLIVFKK